MILDYKSGGSFNMGYATVMEFQKEFPTVNLDMMKNNEKQYEYSMLILFTLEAARGFKVKRVGKTTKQGTKVTYTAFKSKEDVKEFDSIMRKKVDEFNTKWNENLKVTTPEGGE